jgi:transposase
VRAQRPAWRANQPALDPARLKFVDETWASPNLARTPGRCPVGERLVMAVPHGHGPTSTFGAALGVGGLTAPTVADGAMTGELFEAYVRQQLAPTLEPGDVVVLDNLACPKRPGVVRAVEAAGGRGLFRPPYSPDLNPIEKAFSKLKALLRRAAERTVEGLWALLGRVLDEFRPEECRHYFRSGGYATATPT